MDSTFYIPIGDRTIYTTVTADPDTVTNWISGVTNHFRRKRTVIFGLDIKWKPSWGTGVPYRVATLHICAGNRCLIVKLLHINHFPRSLGRFLRNPRYVFAGVDIERDGEKLYRDHNLEIENWYDLRREALKMEEAGGRLTPWPGLKDLAWEVAGVVMGKSGHVSVGDWNREVLSEEQIEYACLDAYASCRVGVILYLGLEWNRIGVMDDVSDNYSSDYYSS